LRTVSLGAPVIQIDRDPGQAYVAEIPQLDRIRAAFGKEIADGRVSVDAKGDYIAIRVGNLQLFDTGSVEVKPGFAELARRIAEVLNSRKRPDPDRGPYRQCAAVGPGPVQGQLPAVQARADSCWPRC
jgi:type VI secretion system protein ImpK